VIAFVRHGQTAVNREGRLQGRIDAPLSELGTRQADELGAALASAAVTRVVSSPLQRAQSTAAAIARAHGLTVDVDERLIELDYGEWDGSTFRDIPSVVWASWQQDVTFAPPGGEALTDVTARVADFCVDTLGDDLVVAVSHVSPIKAAACLALGTDERASWRMHLDVASITRIGARPDGSPFLASYNEAADLRSRFTPRS
jgi:probable phosphoglycerate mutase